MTATTPDAPPLGFWKIAETFPDHLALVDEEREITAGEISFQKEGRFVVGGEIDTFTAYEQLKDGQPTTTPTNRQMGLVMNYTSGTTGRPKGVRRKLQDVDPETGGGTFGGMLYLFGL